MQTKGSVSDPLSHYFIEQGDVGGKGSLLITRVYPSYMYTKYAGLLLREF